MNYLVKTSIFLMAVLLFASLMWATNLAALAQQSFSNVEWTQPQRIPSPDDSSSWFPDLAVDSHDNVHVVWNETKAEENRDLERVFYSMWNGKQWTPFNDIVAPQVDIIRNSIAADGNDILYFVYGWLNLFYKTAPVEKALSAAAWSTPHRINTRTGSYASDVAIDGSRIYVLYDDAGALDENSPCLSGCADIFFRTSLDLGNTWLEPVPLFPTSGGSARPQISVDTAGVIHASWDEGWDRLSGAMSPERFGVYMNSKDGGKTWSEPTIVTHPAQSNFQTTAGSDGRGGVLLVWRTDTLDYPGIYYMWSTDYGQTWSPPKTIPGIAVRKGDTPFDTYSLGADSAGNIHLLAAGQSPDKPDYPPQLYHVVWNGQSWSVPFALYDDVGAPEYPHLVIHNGNQIHATWFTRFTDTNMPHQIWYARGKINAPQMLPTVTPTVTPTPVPPTRTPTPTVTPKPTLPPQIVQAAVPGDAVDTIYTENDDLWLLFKSLLPAMALIVVVVVVIRIFRS
ncbi:MAG: exo-alpha-sialidase [Chloroflexi bacterium]|nr:MAG: exo-alpha-sialidase [Chloroflexota bacterium]